MKNRARQAALRIALVLEEFSEEEITAAVKLLERQHTSSVLLNHFSAEKPSSDDTRPKVRTKPIEEQRSKAVINLERIDPAKYRLLSEFDSMVRRGQILATHEDLKRFGERISKDFSPKKSRKETIGALLALIAPRGLSEIEGLVKYATSFGTTGSMDEYQQLAKFIIKGKTTPNEQ